MADSRTPVHPTASTRTCLDETRAAQAARLQQALEHERAAISGIEDALAAMDDAPAVVLENGERVFNEMFAEWEAGEGTPGSERSDTYMHLACMRSAGWDTVDYADVITLSGYGPSFGYSQEKWWAHYFPPPDRIERIANATGFGFRWVQYETAEDYWQAMVQAIDAGHPARGPYMAGVLFIGYRDAERPEDRQIRPLARVFVEPGSWWSWEQFVDWHRNHSDGGWHGSHTGRVDAIPAKQSAIDVLRLMV